MKRTILTIILTFVMIMSLMSINGGRNNAYAGTNGYSQDAAVNYAKSLVGTAWDVDNGSYDCVDILKKYFLEIGGQGYSAQGNAGAYATTAVIPSGWQRMYMSGGYTPQPGDVAVWGFNAKQWNVVIPTGHVGIVVSVNGNTITLVDQDTNSQRAAAYNNYRASDVTCFIHPDFSNNGSSTTANVKPGVYSIHSAINNNLVLDIANGKDANGTNIQTQNYHGGPAQRFNVINKGEYYMIYPQCATSKCIDTENNSSVSGANIFLWEESSAAGQHWEFVDAGGGYYYIRSKNGMYLDVTNGTNAIQVNIQSCTFNGSNAQKWKLVEEKDSISDGYYSIHSAKDNNLVLDIYDGSQSNGGNLWLHEYNGSRAEIFYVKKESEGHYSIQPNCSGLLIDTSSNSSTSGANLQQWEKTGANGQKWNLLKAPTSGTFYVMSNLGNLIDVTNGNYANGTNIQSCRFNGAMAQQWVFMKEDMSRFKPDTPTATVSGSNGEATIKWNNVKKDKYEIIYDVRLFNNATGSGDYYKVKWGVDGLSTSFNGLTEGNYSITVAAVDKIDHSLFSGVRVVAFQVDSSGKIITSADLVKKGWNKIDGNWYYYDNNLSLKKGWLLDGVWYYLDPATGIMQTGWVKDGNTWYYLNSSGAMATGWVKVGETWYYMNSGGAMQTGWQKINGTWYFFKNGGAMAVSEWVPGYYWISGSGAWTYQPRGSWKQDSTGWWFGDTSGWYAKSTTQKIDNVNYTFNAAGYWVK